MHDGCKYAVSHREIANVGDWGNIQSLRGLQRCHAAFCTHRGARADDCVSPRKKEKRRERNKRNKNDASASSVLECRIKAFIKVTAEYFSDRSWLLGIPALKLGSVIVVKLPLSPRSSTGEKAAHRITE